MISISGQVPSKKNSRTHFVRGGRIVDIPNKNFRDWQKQALWQLKGQTPILTPTGLRLEFWFKDLRKRDLDNVVSSVLDCIKDGGLIPDDSVAHIPSIQAVFMGIDRTDPRVEIKIIDKF